MHIVKQHHRLFKIWVIGLISSINRIRQYNPLSEILVLEYSYHSINYIAQLLLPGIGQMEKWPTDS
jgi:hypothetical protein